MERWARPSHRRGGRDNPSFSSSLLDAIYRSIDEPEEKQRTGGAPDLTRKKPNPATVTKKQSELQYHRHQHYPPFLPSTTSTSSSGSSSGGFFSDSDSSRLKPIRTCAPPPRPARSRSDLPPPSPEKKKKKMIASSIRSRIRDLRKGRAVAGSAPASPGARLASFLNAIFSGAGSPKKTKKASAATTTTACSSATACTRSCLSKTPPSGARGGGKRTVRFGPVSVVAGEDDVGDLAAAAWKKESRRMVEEMLRGFGAELDDDDGGESDASSDLFELEDLVGRGGGYRDELPVYETTRPRHHLSGLRV